MKNQYDPNVLINGLKMRSEKEETPQTFEGERPRMAGERGEFALSILSNPAAAQSIGQWNDQFNQSNEGFQFNEAKMRMAGAHPDQVADRQHMMAQAMQQKSKEQG
mgnify:CR=1 FL=1|tara:strand:+ start:2063 stop:2380 length:318 start_codon:yes stop_codon:yes gene_type:complete